MFYVMGWEGHSEGVVTSGSTRGEAVRNLFGYLPEWGTLVLVHPSGERETFAAGDADCNCTDPHCQV